MRVYEMIADMRLFARPPQPEPQRFDLAALLDRIVGDVGPQAAEQGTTVCRTGTAEPVEVEADRAQLNIAVRAVVQNALEAVGGAGRVEVSLRRRAGQVEIRVADDGPGITPEERRHLFDPYYSARQAGRGLGLGLSKAWRILDLHGGRIEVDSEPGRGATLVLLLPPGNPAAAAPPSPAGDA
jgi:hypothetical protein